MDPGLRRGDIVGGVASESDIIRQIPSVGVHRFNEPFLPGPDALLAVHRSFNTHSVIQAKDGTHPEMTGPAVDAERPRDGSRPAPG